MITGGAGFIGINSAAEFIRAGWKVIIFDNLSRKGVDYNIGQLAAEHHGAFELIVGDVRYDHFRLLRAVQQADVVLHLAAQVAVTTSVTHPRQDFEVNAVGTHNLLEAVREAGHKPLVMYASTNKVYGGMDHVPVVEESHRYRFRELPHGISEHQNLDFHSPYGCSKGAADQYMHDYHRMYDIPTVVFRQSCIYGPRQFGIEDQGWVAWFIIAAMLDKPITIYGNGKQVRDLLYIDDLTELYLRSAADPARFTGKVYNIGGGPANTLSLLEFLSHLELVMGKRISYSFGEVRPGDQPIYISDIGRVGQETGWQPKIDPYQGTIRLYDWAMRHRGAIERFLAN